MADYASKLGYFTVVNLEHDYSRDMPGLSSYDPAGVSKKYYMRAYHTVLTKFVYWISQNTPDLTGSGSGYNPVDLTDVIVLRYS